MIPPLRPNQLSLTFVAMPSFQPRVSFAPTPVYSRQPRDDEAYVMKAFSRHASHCDSCNDPYSVHRSGGTLCPKGHQRALDVAQYVYSKRGKAYSLVDRECNQRVQIEIPVGCDSVRSLLSAMERGLRIMKRAPSVSYDRTYYVAPRRPANVSRPSTRELRLETPEPPLRTNGPQSRNSSMNGCAGKGSLFASDMKEREHYFRTKPTVYYRVRTDASPPVPPKEYYYG